MKNTRFIHPMLTLLCLAATGSMTAAQQQVQAICFLEGVEPDARETLMFHKLEVEVRCAASDRMVLDVADFDLRLFDGDRDLIAAGVAWKEEHLEANPNDNFFSSEPTNAITVSETGRERSVQLRAHTHALPDSGIVRLEGSVDLVVEADCVGEGARDPIAVATNVEVLREGLPISIPTGGEVATTEQGMTNEDPMLGIAGDGSYFGLVKPPDGVREMVFFGKKRLVVDATVSGDAAVTLQICPTETVRVPVSIEAAI